MTCSLSNLLIDNAEDIGGTRFWNRYPVLLPTCILSSSATPKGYLASAVDKYDLRKHIQSGTELFEAQFDESLNLWRMETSEGKPLSTRYLMTGLGQLARKNISGRGLPYGNMARALRL
ncbi:putative Cyclohexanone monooxygenase [Seiridium cardinale]